MPLGQSPGLPGRVGAIRFLEPAVDQLIEAITSAELEPSALRFGTPWLEHQTSKISVAPNQAAGLQGTKSIEGNRELHRQERDAIQPNARANDCQITNWAGLGSYVAGDREQGVSVDHYTHECSPVIRVVRSFVK
jgi:hypothetical protein